MVVGLILPMQSVPITTTVVSSIPAHGEVYSIHHFVIKFVSDSRQDGFLLVILFVISVVKHHHPTHIAQYRLYTNTCNTLKIKYLAIHDNNFR